MLFTSCANNLTSISSVSVANATYTDDIVITGTGFSVTQCENRVKIGGVDCALVSGSMGQLTCRLGANSGLYPNYLYGVEVLVANQGYALVGKTFEVGFVPKVDSVSPNVGSSAGGTKIRIQGEIFF